MKIEVRHLTGKALDFAVAKCEGYGWARNMSGRSGDSMASYRDPEHKPNWPIGSRSFVSLDRLKNLNSTEGNWAGWCTSDMSEPVAPGAFSSIPTYHRRWEDSGPIIERESLGLDPYADYPRWKSGNCFGLTPLEAAMRCYVASTLGEEIEIPDELMSHG
jgi:hypothetical protein